MQYKNMEVTNMKNLYVKYVVMYMKAKLLRQNARNAALPLPNSRKWLLKWAGLLNTL